MSGIFDSNEFSDEQNFAIFDLETTGLNYKEDDILEIAICNFYDKKMSNLMHSYIFSDKEIRPKITAINKITKNMIINAPKLDEVCKNILKKYNSDYIYVGHNCHDFDAPFLMAKLPGLFDDIRFLDTKLMARALLPGLSNVSDYSMTSLTSLFGIEIVNQHTARGDTEALGKLLYKLLGLVDNYLDVNKYIKTGNSLAKKIS